MSFRYVKNIIHSTPKSTDQVIVEPDGAWKLQPQNSTKHNSPSDDDEDIVIVNKSNGSIKMDTPNLTAPSSNKRPISVVIDLTSDDDEPARPVKRQISNGHIVPSFAHTPC